MAVTRSKFEKLHYRLCAILPSASHTRGFRFRYYSTESSRIFLIRVPHKVYDKVKELNDEEPKEIIPGLPSGHHRFIRFRTEQYHHTGTRVWGTMERLGPGVVCALYRSESASVRSCARVTQTGLLPFSDQLEMSTKRLNVDKVFRDIGGGWNGDYHLTDNNCVHYALECWDRLGGKASWNDVVDAHDSFIPGDHDAAGRDCSIM